MLSKLAHLIPWTFKCNGVPTETPVIKSPTNGMFDGWADFINGSVERFQKMPDAFLTDYYTGLCNYDLRLFDAIQDEFIERTVQVISMADIRKLEAHASGSSDYLTTLAYQCHLLEQDIKRGIYKKGFQLRSDLDSK